MSGAAHLPKRAYLLPSLLSPDEATLVRRLAESDPTARFARDPDTVDRLPTFECAVFDGGKPVATAVCRVLEPVVTERLLPYLRQRFDCASLELASTRYGGIYQRNAENTRALRRARHCHCRRVALRSRLCRRLLRPTHLRRGVGALRVTGRGRRVLSWPRPPARRPRAERGALLACIVVHAARAPVST